MRLFPKIAISIIGAILAGMACTMTAITFVFAPQYQNLDRETAVANAERIYEFLQNEVEATSSIAVDWGHWDETFEFARTQDRSFKDNNLKPEDLASIRIDEVVIARADRSILFKHKSNPADVRPAAFAALNKIPGNFWPAFGEKLERKAVSGIVSTEHGPIIVSTSQITDSQNNGPSPGFLFFVRRMDEPFLRGVREKTNLDFSLAGYSADRVRGTQMEIGRTIKSLATVVSVNGSTIVEVPILSPAGTPDLVIRAVTKNQYSQLGRETLFLVGLVVLIIGLLISGVLFVAMRRVVLAPLQRITVHASDIAKTGDLSKTLNMSRSDELGWLANGLDQMVADLRDARNQLKEKSYISGMADIAADMLHNIRNTMGPVPTAIWKGSQSLKELRFDRFAQAADALAQDGGDASRKAKFAEYLKSSTQKISEVCRNAEAEFATISECTRQIELVMQSHDELSRGERLLETASVFELIKNSAVLAEGNGCEVVISPNVARLPVVPMQRSALQQALNNLFVNAKQSIARANSAAGRIVVEGQEMEDAVEITIADNGAGIAPGLIQSIFQRGFTTHSGRGIGLHSAASSLGAMKGKIAAFSDGLGAGATFRITLPKKATEEKAA